MSFSAAGRLLGKSYSDSVVRRTVLLAMIITPAFGANFVVQYSAAALFPPNDFGLFFVANTMGNLLSSGSLIINIYFTRFLVTAQTDGGDGALFAAVRKLEKIVIVGGAGLAGLVFLALVGAAWRLGVESRLVLLLITLDAYTCYVADLGRVTLQSLRRTVQLGLYTLAWMVLRLILCVSGIVLVHTVWGALTGVVASAVIIFLLFDRWVAKAMDAGAALSKLPPMTGLISSVLSYGLLVALSNLDILVSYFSLPADELGVYSASAVFPKAILVVITPLLQMLFPMLLTSQRTTGNFKRLVVKSVGVVFALAVVGAGMVWLLSGWLCGGAIGLKLCQPAPLTILLLSVIPLAMMRALVVLQFAVGRDWLPLWLVLPTLWYLWISWHAEPSMMTFAWTFTEFSAVSCVFLVVVHLAAETIDRLKAKPA